MATPPSELSEEQFLNLLEQHQVIPDLCEDLSKSDWTNEKQGLRCTVSGLMPTSVDVWVFDNGLCLVRRGLFDRMKEALCQSA